LLMQLEQLKNMGPLDQLVDMIPGMNKLPIKGMTPDENQLKYSKAIIQSMTPLERRNPSILDRSRRMRIAAGSGTDVRQVNQLFDQLKFMNRMVKQQTGMMGMPQIGANPPGKKRKNLKRRKKRKSR
ncbi:MAG: signal recognition particle protein, partial [Candidatus Poribacteria bacterium]|nr:signal recognition particle protein [Candidatus Poribacteria bacterium]